MLRIASVLAFALLGCASAAATGVPALDADSLKAPLFTGVEPREIAVNVEDKRAPVLEDSRETIGNVRAAAGGALSRAGFTLRAKSPNTLTLFIENAEQRVGDIEQDSCIQIRGRIDAPSIGAAEAFAIGCYEYRHGLGFAMGSDATNAYQTAIEYVFNQLDQQLAAKHGA